MLSTVRRHGHAALVAATVLALAACGGDDAADDTPDTAAPSATTATPDTTTGPDDTNGPDDTTSPDETTGPDDTTSPDETTDPDDTTGPDETTSSSGGRVELLDAGAEDERMQLPGTATVGQSGTGSATINVDATGAVEVTVGLTLGYEAEIVEADEDGYTSETTITEAELTEAPAGVDETALEPIVGVRYRQSFAADGTPSEIEIANEDELTDEQISAFQQFGSELSSAAVAFPDEPVGAGARWTSTTAIQSQGLELDVTYEYEVIELEGSAYVLQISYDQPIDEDVEQSGQTISMSGNVSGEGSVQGSTENPLQNTTELDQQFSLDLEGGGQAFEMQMDIQVLLENEPD